jgi:hypothetical protein
MSLPLIQLELGCDLKCNYFILKSFLGKTIFGKEERKKLSRKG